jgi:hypothetical protein
MLFGEEKLDVSIDEGEVAGGLTSGPSPKMEALFEGIKAMKKGEKAVIFSQVSRQTLGGNGPTTLQLGPLPPR